MTAGIRLDLHGRLLLGLLPLGPPRARQPPDRGVASPPWLLAGILVTTFLVYLPSLQNQLTNRDDWPVPAE